MSGKIPPTIRQDESSHFVRSAWPFPFIQPVAFSQSFPPLVSQSQNKIIKKKKPPLPSHLYSLYNVKTFHFLVISFHVLHISLSWTNLLLVSSYLFCTHFFPYQKVNLIKSDIKLVRPSTVFTSCYKFSLFLFFFLLEEVLRMFQMESQEIYISFCCSEHYIVLKSTSFFASNDVSKKFYCMDCDGRVPNEYLYKILYTQNYKSIFLMNTKNRKS